MGSIGPLEVVVILVVALLVLGPHRLPDAARSVGKAMAELRRMTTGFQSEVRDAFSEPTTPAKRPAPAEPVALPAGAEPDAATTAAGAGGTGSQATGTDPAEPLAAEPPAPGPRPTD